MELTVCRWCHDRMSKPHTNAREVSKYLNAEECHFKAAGVSGSASAGIALGVHKLPCELVKPVKRNLSSGYG